MRRQLTLDIVGGFTTEKQFEQIHTSFMGGLGYELGYQAGTNGPGLITLRAGYGFVDAPKILQSPSVTSQLVEVQGGLPQFEHLWSPTASFTFAHPISQGTYLFVSANAFLLREHFSTAGPDQWNISVGTAINADAAYKLLEGVIKPFATIFGLKNN
jgi:hypothetical protein